MEKKEIKYTHLLEYDVIHFLVKNDPGEYGGIDMWYALEDDGLYIRITEKDRKPREGRFDISLKDADTRAILRDFLETHLTDLDDQGSLAYLHSDIFSRHEFNAIYKKAKQLQEARIKLAEEEVKLTPSPILELCRKLKIDTWHSGDNRPDVWSAQCPDNRFGHTMEFDTMANKWRCRYCNIVGQIAELEQWVTEKRKLKGPWERGLSTSSPQEDDEEAEENEEQEEEEIDPELIEEFRKMHDQKRLALFHKMINGQSTPYDRLLRIWWWNRY